MPLLSSNENQDHYLVTIYQDTDGADIETIVKKACAKRSARILIPNDINTLSQACQNSCAIFIGTDNTNFDETVRLVRKLKNNRLIACDIIAVDLEKSSLDHLKLMESGFDLCLTLKDLQSHTGAKPIIKHKLEQGAKRLASLMIEEEYRRFSDALSCAPTSVLVFDNDKRIVFVSEHYFRAYPKSAPRLIRGLSVYDAFDMMSREEGIPPSSKLYNNLQRFWYALDGDLEFTMPGGTSYRLKAAPLSNQRGSIVTAQNITDYVVQNEELKNAMKLLQNIKS